MTYRVLSEVPRDWTIRDVVFSGRGEAAFVASADGLGYWVVRDGRSEGRFDHVSELVVDFEVGRVAYVGSRGNLRFVVVNGSERGPFDWAGGLALLRGGSCLFTAVTGAEYTVRVDDDLLGPFDEATRVVTSPGLDSFAFAALADSTWRTFQGRRPGPPFDEVTAPRVLRAGMAAYCGLRGSKWQALVGDEAQVTDLDEVAGSPSVGWTGAWALWAARADRWRVESDLGRQPNEFESFVHREPVLDPNGKRVAYVGGRAQGVYVCVNDREFGPWPASGPVVFSGTNDVVAWVAASAPQRRAVIVNGCSAYSVGAIPNDQDASALATECGISENGSEIAVVGTSGDRQHVFVNGSPGRGFPVIAQTPIWSGSSGWVYSAMTLGKQWVVAGNDVLGGFDRVWLEPAWLRAKGEQAGFGARVDNQLRWYVIQAAAS